MSAGPVTAHLTDEDLLLDYYGEGPPGDRARIRQHLETCLECRAFDRELKEVLEAIDRTPVTEPPSDFERAMWSRLEPLLPVGRPPLAGTERLRVRPALAIGLATAAVVVLLIAAFSAGRLSNQPVERAAAPTIDERARAERLLRSEVEDHFERSQQMLVELVTGSADSPVRFASGRARAADLVASGRLYRRSAEEVGDADVGMLLEDLERVLLEVANSSPRDEARELAWLRQRIEDQDLLFRLRVVAQEIRQTEQLPHGVVTTSAR